MVRTTTTSALWAKTERGRYVSQELDTMAKVTMVVAQMVERYAQRFGRSSATVGAEPRYVQHGGNTVVQLLVSTVAHDKWLTVATVDTIITPTAKLRRNPRTGRVTRVDRSSIVTYRVVLDVQRADNNVRGLQRLAHD